MKAAAARLSDLGEDAVVAAITSRLASGPLVRVGPGDDCAVIGRPRAAHWELLKTDAVIEGIHFLKEERAARVGWKALCRAISDIAAMGGTPLHAVVTVAAPADLPLQWLRDAYAGMERAGKAYGVRIVGGETARSPGPLFLSVALTGTVPRRQCILRSGGRPNDRLFVTGRLGGSLRTGKHLDFKPRLAEAQWLAVHFRPAAMMDLSDGLHSDLPRLAAQSKCGWHLDPSRVPLTRGCSLAEALGDGEDYELLFAIGSRKARDLPAAWHKQFPKLTLTGIGELTPLSLQPPLQQHGYDHFKQPR